MIDDGWYMVNDGWKHEVHMSHPEHRLSCDIFGMCFEFMEDLTWIQPAAMEFVDGE